MKLNIVTYLIKNGFSEGEALDPNKTPNRLDIDINGTNCGLYLKKHRSKPKWSEVFSKVESVDQSLFSSTSVKGLLIVPVSDRLLAFTFGHGRSMIQPYTIERGFGLRVALNICDSEKIKQIDKSTLEKVSLNTRSQTSKNTNVNDFDFEFDQEILKSICALVDESESSGKEIVAGSDSVAISTEIELETIPELAERLLLAYGDTKYQQKYPWVDFIQGIKDPELIECLNDALIKLIDDERFENVWISPPEIIDYTNFSGFVYKKKSKQSPCFHSELDLEAYLSEAKPRGQLSLGTLKRREIRIYDASEQDVNGWSLHQCMNSEIEFEGELYILNDGSWYRVDKEFSDAVNQFFQRINSSGIDFPPYMNMHEGDYLRSIADGESFALLDQKWIYPAGSGNNRIEFCDLLSGCDAFIHVKKYGSSSVLSHLFSQASVAIDNLMNDPTVQVQVNEHLDDTYLSVNFKSEESPRKYRVVLAVMQKTPGELHLPFFSKVNLRHHARRLRNMGFEVELAKIRCS